MTDENTESEEKSSSAHTERTAEAEPTQAGGETHTGLTTDTTHVDDDVDSLALLADELHARYREREAIRDDNPTTTKPASLVPDIEQSAGTVEVFTDEADDEAIERLHELDTEIARLMLDNQDVVIGELVDATS